MAPVMMATPRATAILAVALVPLGIVMGGPKSKGEMLVYRGVPQDVYDGLIAAESPGAFFNRKIKGVYQTV